MRRRYLVTLCSIALLSTGLRAEGTSDVIIGRFGVQNLPEGCGNPFLDAPSFLGFFNSSLALMAAKRGPEARGVADLFAVSEIQKEIDSQFPNPAEESVIDRQIINQICQYQRIETQRYAASGGNSKNPLQILSSDEAWHNHLANISSKLYRDVRKLAVELLAAQAKEKNKEGLLTAKAADIKRARELGRQKVKDLFE